MKALSPLLRLVLITASVLIMAFFGVVSLRFLASSAPPQLAQLPGQQGKPVIFATGDKDVAEPSSLKAYEATVALGDRVIPVVEVRPTPEHEWVIFRPTEPAVTEGLVVLTDFMVKFKPAKLMVIVHTREVAGADSILKLLGERPEPLITYIFSPNHRVNREIKKQRPLWLSGADASLLAQWHVFAAVWLEPMVATDFDWVLKGGPYGHKEEFHPRVREEMRRRQIGEIQFLETGDEPLNDNLYGVFTGRPSALLRR